MNLAKKVLMWMAAGIVVGIVFQWAFDSFPEVGLKVTQQNDGLKVVGLSGPAKKSKFQKGDVLTHVVWNQGTPEEERERLTTVDELTQVVNRTTNGDVLWLQTSLGPVKSAAVGMSSRSPRAQAIAPFAFVADIFMALLKMLIVPLVFLSVTLGVTGLGNARTLRRMGTKTFIYYFLSSLVAILVGQVLVNVMQPGTGAALGLQPIADAGVAPDASFIDVLKRAVPSNIFSAFSDNGAMLQIIFFALLLGYFVTVTQAPHGERVKWMLDSFLHVIMRLAEGVLKLIPYGVFALVVKVVASTGVGIFAPLAWYMLTVVAALLVHAVIVLPIVIRFVAKVSPIAWFKAMSPALMTAFSTSSSSMTLPVTMDTVQKRGKISSKVSSFTLPLGATINMDGTALYECIGVIFLAQYYATAGGFDLTLSSQALVVVMALLASIGAAGIPSAGLVMMLTILSALGLPLEGAALLLAVDRPLDMLRTTVNVWSDSCAATVIARLEGETALEGGVADS
jgi:proton glutamate symport protein